jgi:hypothetical protein
MAKLHVWHRYVGITAAFFVIILSVTGLALNFNEQLRLDTTPIDNNWLLNHYSIGSFPVTSFEVDSKIVSKASDFVYINGQYAITHTDKLVGAIIVDDTLVLATSGNLLLFDQENELIDEIGKLTGLPEKPLGVSLTQNGEPVLRGVNTYWKGSHSLDSWQPLEGPHPKWIAPIETPDNINSVIQEHARSNEINLERVMLDLHSGRLFGGWGENIMSISAILLIFLSITGIIIWSRKKPSSQ